MLRIIMDMASSIREVDVSSWRFHRIRIAMAQINTTVGDLKGNIRKMQNYIEVAEENRADLVVFPELAVTGYPL